MRRAAKVGCVRDMLFRMDRYSPAALARYHAVQITPSTARRGFFAAAAELAGDASISGDLHCWRTVAHLPGAASSRHRRGVCPWIVIQARRLDRRLRLGICGW